MKVYLAKKIGFCFGVRRAVEIALREVKKKGLIFSLGDLIHNPQMIEQLKEKGIKNISNLKNLRPGDVLIIRSHGLPLEILAQLRKKRIKVVDATCPFVKKAQNLVGKLQKEGYRVIIVGEKNHPEVRALLSYAGSQGKVMQNIKEASRIRIKGKIGIVAQTTQTLENFKEVVACLLEKSAEMKIYNTLCPDVLWRQQEAKELARQVAVMLVVGGQDSANTRSLVRVCQGPNCKVYHLETARELKESYLEGVKSVGITSGASTPFWIIDKVKERIGG